MRKRSFYIILSACLIMLSACGPDLKLAKQAYKNGDYAIAIAQWEALSEFGIPKAHLELAKVYAKGTGVERDLDMSLALLNKAIAENENSLARPILQVKSIIGSEFLRHGNSKFQTIGRTYLEAAKEAGHPKAFFELARMYEEGYGVSKNATKAIALYTTSADMGYTRALYYQGRMFYRGKTVRRNYKRALELYLSAYDQGYSKVAVDIGRIYEKGLGVPINIEAAKSYYTIASKNGVARATKYLSRL